MTETATHADVAQQEIAAVLAEAKTDAFVHARDIDSGEEFGYGADEGVILASVFKIPVVLQYAREVAAGTLDPTEHATVTAEFRSGGIGIGGCADDVTASWRDLALLMMSFSDNAATDCLYDRLGLDNIVATLRSLGLEKTNLIRDCRGLFKTVYEDLGVDKETLLEYPPIEILRTISIMDPARSNSSTPREITLLLAAIWKDEAGPASACEEVRTIMSKQVWPHRLSSGFPDEVTVAAKTGTLGLVRNEAGVVTYPDGKRYAVGVFTKSHELTHRAPKIDASIGTVGRIAIEALRNNN
ncbi:serine hydrolase [Rhodococcus sp. NPDC056743]|uniref:serine hydrolase n=1 Tax=Rhodococcus sp. NPDC056743 TaxID=3345934 RepID=UPI00366F093D